MNKEKTKRVLKRIVSMKYKKYILALGIGVILVGFVGDNCVWAHLRNRQKINELRKALAQKEEEARRSQEEIYKLQTDFKTMERVAYEMHFMKREDEDVFTLSDENVDSLTTNIMQNETIE
ncbi:MAG: septum formation initiator family protein [Prevotella sp.]|nr:septum formation initiator family protein [Prevotella sp.]